MQKHPKSNSFVLSRALAGKKGENGFSLIEVTIAMGLLATVLISIASLFIMGGKQVQSGKQTTTAMSIADGILERTEQLNYTDIYGFFAGTATSTSVTAATTDTANNANEWQAVIEEKLGPGASGTITLTPLGTASPLNMGSAHAIQVRVTLNWSELGRARDISIQTVRF